MGIRTLTAEEQSIESLAREFFAARAPLESQHQATRVMATDGARPGNQRKLCVELARLDFFAQAATEQEGGMGLSPLASCLVAEAGGAELVPGSWLDQLIAVRLLRGLGVEVLAPVLSADRIVAIGIDAPEPTLRWVEDRTALTGTTPALHFGHEADRWVVLLADSVVVIDPRASGVGEPTPLGGLDPLAPVVSAHLDDVVAEHVFYLDAHDRAALLAHVSAMIGAFAVGAASRCLDIAIDYVKQREQFGRVIGSFQAIKHRAANAAIDLLHSRSLVRAAMTDESGAVAHEARIAADRCYRAVAESALQMHGGIGFTTEVPIHLYLKNAQWLRAWPRPVDESFVFVRRQLQLDDAVGAA